MTTNNGTASEPEQKRSQRRFEKAIARGAFVNLIGLSAKLINPLALLLIPWLFGTEVLGVYLLALFLSDIVSNIVTGGLVDATTLFASRHIEKEKYDESEHNVLNHVMANAFAMSVGISLLLAPLMFFGAAFFVDMFYPEYPELVFPLRLLAIGLPALALLRIAIAGTKAYMRMEYDAAISGFFQPLSFLSLVLVVKFVGGSVDELILSQVLTYWLSAVLALWALSRHFRLTRLFVGLAKLRFDRDIISFAIPHSINMSLSRYVMRLDVIMLGAYGISAQMLGLYGIASMIVNEMRQARMIFASALAPVTARYHATDQREQLELIFNRVSRWTTSIIVPLSFVMVVLRDDLLRIVNASYTGDTRFMALLLFVPLLGCAFGLAGNCIIYTGHSRWNLFNNVAAAAFATGFNMLFIPHWGLLGAAISAVLAALIANALQLWELARLEGVYLRMRHLYHSYAAFAVAAVVLIVLWDPAQLPFFWLRAIVAVAFFISIIGIMAATGHPELRAWIARRRNKS